MFQGSTKPPLTLHKTGLRSAKKNNPFFKHASSSVGFL
jgi:hypothetical protein